MNSSNDRRLFIACFIALVATAFGFTVRGFILDEWARVFDLGQVTVQVATADYGTKFMVVAGLLNIISAVDAHSLATGRKRS